MTLLKGDILGLVVRKANQHKRDKNEPTVMYPAQINKNIQLLSKLSISKLKFPNQLQFSNEHTG